MKREEETPKVQTTGTSPQQNQEVSISSASVENAHASGDGAVKKTDELSFSEDSEKTKTESTPY
jgi:hypothetical protein